LSTSSEPRCGVSCCGGSSSNQTPVSRLASPAATITPRSHSVTLTWRIPWQQASQSVNQPPPWSRICGAFKNK